MDAQLYKQCPVIFLVKVSLRELRRWKIKVSWRKVECFEYVVKELLNCYCTGPNSVISENLLKNGARTSTCRTGVIWSFYYELPNDDSSGIETCSSVECHLLNRIPFDFLDLFKFLTLALGCLRWSSSLAHYGATWEQSVQTGICVQVQHLL